MNPGRKQYTLGSLMIVIAILAVGFAYPVVSWGLIVGAALPVLLFLLLNLLQYLLAPTARRLADTVSSWLDSKVPDSPTGREP